MGAVFDAARGASMWTGRQRRPRSPSVSATAHCAEACRKSATCAMSSRADHAPGARRCRSASSSCSRVPYRPRSSRYRPGIATSATKPSSAAQRAGPGPTRSVVGGPGIVARSGPRLSCVGASNDPVAPTQRSVVAMGSTLARLVVGHTESGDPAASNASADIGTLPLRSTALPGTSGELTGAAPGTHRVRLAAQPRRSNSACRLRSPARAQSPDLDTPTRRRSI